MKEALRKFLHKLHGYFLGCFVSRLYSAIVIDPPKIKTVKIHGTPCRFDIGSSYEHWYISNFEDISPNESATQTYLTRIIQPGDVFYDIGANIGAYVVWLNVAFNLKATVAFEPSPDNFAVLCRNLSLNKGHHIALPVAVSDRSGYGRMFQREEGAGSANGFIVNYSGAMVAAPPASRSYIVRQEPVDAMISAGLIPPPDVVLIDVDGGEISVLRGMTGALQGVRALIVEVADNTALDVDTILTELGLTMKQERQQRRGNRVYERYRQ